MCYALGVALNYWIHRIHSSKRASHLIVALGTDHAHSVDPQRLMLCFSVDRWQMPPITRLSAMACRTFNSVLEHLGVVHLPTFKLSVRGLRMLTFHY